MADNVGQGIVQLPLRNHCCIRQHFFGHSFADFLLKIFFDLICHRQSTQLIITILDSRDHVTCFGQGFSQVGNLKSLGMTGVELKEYFAKDRSITADSANSSPEHTDTFTHVI